MKPLTQKRQKAGSPQAASRCLSALLWKDIAQMRLLELGSTASLFDLFLDLFGFVLGRGFFNRRRSTFYQLFGFFQTQASQFTNGLDYVYFLLTRTGKYNVKLGLLFSSSFATTSSGRRSSNGCSGRNTEFFFHCFNQRNYVHYAHFSDCVQNVFVRQSHDFLPKI
mmetsp:Transcript_11213/g.36923  ORF Transcript_11213/g.36923 Transcript_11213/m.36923 type:complete len:166 (+) Transcript_11213:231-728(+)